MCAGSCEVARDTDQEVETRVQVSRESHPSGTDGDRRRAVDRQHASARVDVPTVPPFCSLDQGVRRNRARVLQEQGFGGVWQPPHQLRVTLFGGWTPAKV